MPRKNKGTDTSVFQARHQSAATIEEFLQHQQHQDLLRFITCGSVDDGKSTLIGRMLWESQQLFDDQLATLRTESVKYGTQGIVDRVFKTTFTRGLSYGPSKGLSKNDRVKETQSAYG